MRAVTLACLLSAACLAQAPAPKPVPAVDREAFTFTQYRLTITLNPQRKGFAVRGTLTMRNDSQQAQSALALQISSTLKWAAIHANGATLTFTSSQVTHDIDHTGAVNEALVELPNPIKPGENVELEVGYQGTIAQDATRLERLGISAAVAGRNDWDGISDAFTALRGVGHVTWYPVSIPPATLTDGNKVFRELGAWRARHAASRFRATYESVPGKTLIANGERRSEVEDVYELDRIGLDGPFFIVAERSTLNTANGRVLFQPGNEEGARLAAAALARLEPVIISGKPASSVIVELPAAWAAYENGTFLLTPFGWRAEKDAELQFIHTFTHAHLSSKRPWINEGAAHMAQAAWRERLNGRAAALSFLAERRLALSLIAPIESGPNDARNSLINATDETYFRSKAMWVWWMLREMLTPVTLQKGMAQYKAEDDLEPAHVQRLLEAASGKELEWFFDDWVYRDRGLPDFRIVSVYPRQNLKGTYLVTVTIENLGRAGAEVPIRLRMKVGETTTRLLVKAKSQATIRVETAQPPLEVFVNDGSVLEGDDTNNAFPVPEKQ